MRSVEQRSKKRHKIKLPVALLWEKRLIETSTTDLSQQGVSLEIYGHIIPANASVRVCCHIAGKIYELPGRVIHNTEGNVGIEFRKIQNDFIYEALKASNNLHNVSAA